MKRPLTIIAAALTLVVVLVMAQPAPPIVHNNITTNAPGTPIMGSSTWSNPAAAYPISAVTGVVQVLDPANGRLNARNIAGVLGDGVTDCYAGLQSYLNQVGSAGASLYITPGRYLITQTLTVPAGGRISIEGDPIDNTYKGNPAGLRRAIIVTSGNFSGIITPRLSYPNDTLAYWCEGVNIHDLYIVGPGLQASGPSSSVGLDLTGIRNSTIRDVHVEGFGTGIKVDNCSEVDLFGCYVENNFNGFWLRRDPNQDDNVYDCMVNLVDCYSLFNNYSIIEDNVRQGSWIRGEVLNGINFLNVLGTNNSSDTAFEMVSMKGFENHSTGPNVLIDTNGIGSFSLRHNNFETDQDREEIVCLGPYDLLEVVDNQMQRSLTRTNPIISVLQPTVANNFIRSGLIRLEHNAHPWFDMLVRNDTAPISADYVPAGFESLNPNPFADHAADGQVSIAGDYHFSTTSFGPFARTYWSTTTTNNAYTLLISTNAALGKNSLYVSAWVDVNGGTAIPVPTVAGWGNQGVGWTRVGPAFLGNKTNAITSRVFTKIAWYFVLQDQTQVTNGPSAVQLAGIYGDSTNTGTGIEWMGVYAPKALNPYIAPIKVMGADVTTGLMGWRHKGEFLVNTNLVLAPNTYGYEITAEGFVGPAMRLDSVNGTNVLSNLNPVNPGLNTWADYFLASGIVTNYPFWAGMIGDASSVDSYIGIGASRYGGTKASPTFFGSPSGGLVLRSRTSGGGNDTHIQFGWIGSGANAGFNQWMDIDQIGILSSKSNVVVNGVLYMNDGTNLTVQPVTFNTNNSGGAGFKTLIIPN